jgi:hypothetical protein
MPTANRIAGPAIATGTNYLLPDGTLTTTATDTRTWHRRTVNGPVRLQGAFTGGTTIVTVQSGLGSEFNPGLQGVDVDPGTGGIQEAPSARAFDVMSESADLVAALPAGVDVNVVHPWYRVKVVQSGASATAAFLSATG